MTALLEATGRLDGSELGRAATAVAREQVSLAAAFAVLADRLGAAAGMAGDDGPGRAFAGVYGPAADAAFAGFVATVGVLDGVTTTLVTTGNNHARAESTLDTGPRRAPDVLARPPTTGPVTRTPAAVTGPGLPGPWDLVRAYWPLADPDLLLDAASTWRAAATAVADTTAELGTTIAYLESGNSGPDMDAMVAFWAGLIGPGHTLFAELEPLSAAVGTLCDRYGTLVADTHRSIRRAVGLMIAGGLLIGGTGIGLSVVAHAELAAVEAVLNPIADEFAARLAAEVLHTIDPELVASVRGLAAGSATPEAVEAELTELADATGALLGGGARPQTGPGPAGVQVVPRFTADQFANPQLATKHTHDHAKDFGSTTEQSYSDAAARFLRFAQQNQLPALIDTDGVVRIYDQRSNTFASYDSRTGSINTFFKPTSRTYWDNNKMDWGDLVSWSTR